MHRVEHVLYATVVALALFHLIWAGYQHSLLFESGSKWDGYAPGLRQGWLLGRRIDLSDAQWREFRASALPLSATLLAFAALSHGLRRRWPSLRVPFCLGFAAVFLAYLHGFCALYVVALVAANWALAQATAGARFGAFVLWSVNIAVLLSVRLADGFPAAVLLGPRFAWLDSHRGVMRWHICYNLTMLRMLSFALDLHWRRSAEEQQQQQRRKVAPKEDRPPGAHTRGQAGEDGSCTNILNAKSGAAALSPSSQLPRSAKERQSTALPSETDYSLAMSLAHALYPPLYLAGPIITYQDFAWQLRGSDKAAASPGSNGSPTPSPTQLAKRYFWRLFADVACIELVTHCLYFNSLAIHRIGKRYSSHGLAHGPHEVGLTAWWVLSFMWLKFAVIWRTFRLAALLEGVEAPENMVRCFADNYDVEGFWRGWHSSYNRWLVRYMYVPMGGSARRALSIWPIFLFVALWHDLEWRLLSWAWLICAAFLPEMLVKRAAASQRFDGVRAGAAFRAAAAAVCAVNCAGLMAVNMVGFVVGLDGMGDLFREMLGSPHYVGAVLLSFFCAMQLNFAWRGWEKLQAKASKG